MSVIQRWRLCSSPRARVLSRQRYLLVTTIFMIALGLVACGEPEPNDFTDETRDGFLTACTRQLEDSRLTTSICLCVFAETSRAYDFAEFEELEQLLLANRDEPLPLELTSIVADCVVEEGDL